MLFDCCHAPPNHDTEVSGEHLSHGFIKDETSIENKADDTDDKALEAAFANNLSSSWAPILENCSTDLDWMNHLLAHLWPEFEQAMNFIITHKIMPKIKSKALLKSDQISDVTLSEFTLGKLPPKIERVQSSHLPDGVSRVQCWGEYTSDMVAEMGVETNFGTFKCGIKNLKVKGSMVFFLRPFEESMPGTGSFSAFLMEVPSIDFNFLGQAGFIEKLGVKEIIISAMSSVLAKIIVLPHIVTINVGLTNFKVYPPVFERPEPIGVLRVTLVKAEMRQDDENARDRTKTSIRKRLSLAADSVFEYFDTKLGKAMGKDMSNYFGLTVGDEVWKPTVSMKGVTYDFSVVDTEQSLSMNVWDPDFANADDEMGGVGPFKMNDAISLTDKTLRLLDPDKKLVALAQFKTEWLNVERQAVGPTDSMVIFSVRELCKKNGGGLAGCRIAMKGRVGQNVSRTALGVIMKDRAELPVVQEVAKDIRQILEERGVAEDIISEAVSLPAKQTKVSVNSAAYVSFETKDIDTAQLELSVVDVQKKKNAKGRLTGEEEEVVLAELKIPLKTLQSSEGMHMPGPPDGPPIILKGVSSGDFEAEFDLTMCALVPGPLPTGSNEAAPRLSPKKANQPKASFLGLSS